MAKRHKSKLYLINCPDCKKQHIVSREQIMVIKGGHI